MRKLKIILLIILIMSTILGMGYLVYDNIQLNKKVNNMEEKLSYLSASDEHQKLQISQISESEIKEEQQGQLEKETDKSIIENTPTDGLTPITKENAIEIFENCVKEEYSNSLEDYNLISVEKTKVKPTNHFTTKLVKEWIADFEREAYKIYYVQNDNLGDLTGYVDLYTGKVIDGGFRGD